jgi:hypothetical protein
MKTEHKVIVLSVAFFVFVCLIDAFVESFVFHKTAFWDSLIFDVPTFITARSSRSVSSYSG